MKVKIINTPSGEAPEEVRSMWVGLTLPLLVDGARNFQTVGVLTGPKTWVGDFIACIFGKTTIEEGFAVSSRLAIEILESQSTMAANWWKVNTNYYSNSEGVFIFQKESCQIVNNS